MSKIEWTDQTWNPIIGCSKISEGCTNCYAEKMAYRLRCMALAKESFDTLDYYIDTVNDSGKWNSNTFFIESVLEKPKKRKKPTTYFVCSMGDLFHESVSFDDIMKVYSVVAECRQHTFIWLTKRPLQMYNFFKYLGIQIMEAGFSPEPIDSTNLFDYFETLPNLILGVTAENQEQASKRIPILLQIPAAKRFVSCEPLLSSINLTEWLHDSSCLIEEYQICTCSEPREVCIDWVIAGPETGPRKRPMDINWLISLRDQCKSANVEFCDKKDTLKKANK